MNRLVLITIIYGITIILVIGTFAYIFDKLSPFLKFLAAIVVFGYISWSSLISFPRALNKLKLREVEERR